MSTQDTQREAVLIRPESLERAAKALCNHDARFNKWDDYTTRLVREGYRVQARLAITTWCEAEGITVREDTSA